MIAAQIIIKDDVKDRLDQFGKQAPKLLDKVLRMVGSQYRAELKKRYLSGQMLNRREGNLYRSIYVGQLRGHRHVYVVSSRKTTSSQNLGGVSIKRTDSGSIKLANIFEHSGGYTILPAKAKALVFVADDGKIVFTKRVQGSQRPFMSQSARDFRWDSAFQKTTDAVVLEAANFIGLEVER
jgi:hypothetical protein